MVSTPGGLVSAKPPNPNSGVCSISQQNVQIEDTSTPCGLKFLKIASILQITLGILCICLALLGLAAAYNVEEQKAKQLIKYEYQDGVVYNSIRHEEYKRREQMKRRHEAHIKAVREEERRRIVQWFSNKFDKMELKQKCNLTIEDFHIAPQDDNALNYYKNFFEYEKEIPQKEWQEVLRESPIASGNEYFEQWYGTKRYRLIIDYLGIPGWIGIMVIITGLVGLRLISLWDTQDYLQFSHKYTIMNFVCLVALAPGLITVGSLQCLYTDLWTSLLRNVVGGLNISVGVILLILSIILCVVNCCFPVKLRHENYKGISTNVVCPDYKGSTEKTFIN